MHKNGKATFFACIQSRQKSLQSFFLHKASFPSQVYLGSLNCAAAVRAAVANHLLQRGLMDSHVMTLSERSVCSTLPST
eukprot:1384238-Amphidinium_carterae.2